MLIVFNGRNVMESKEEAAVKKLSGAFMQFRYLYRFQKKHCREHPAGHIMLRPSDVMMLLTIHGLQQKHKNGITATELSKNMGIKTPSINAVLSVLEKGGLISRSTDPDDRRFVRILLSRDGKMLTSYYRTHYEEEINGLVSYLGAEKSSQLADLMDEVYSYFRQKEKSQKSVVGK